MKEILQNIRQRYLTFSSYSDCGFSIRIDRMDKIEKRSKLKFETKFQAPDFYEFKTSGESYAEDESIWSVYSDGINCYELDGNGQPQIIEDIPIAKNESVCVNPGCISPIIPLLIPSISGSKITDLQSLDLIGLQVINDETCYLLRTIVVSDLSPREIQLCISKNRKIIVRTEEKYLIDPTRLYLKFGLAFRDSQLPLEVVYEQLSKQMQEAIIYTAIQTTFDAIRFE